MSVVDTMKSKRVTDEIRQAHDDLEYFYLEAKRNKRLAKWAGGLMGLDKKAYFLDLVSEDLTLAGPKPVVDRILQDFAKANINMEEALIWEKIREIEQKILQQMLAEQALKTKEKEKAKKNHHKGKSKKKHKK